MDDLWLTGGRLITPRGVIEAALRVRGGRIAAIRPRAPRAGRIRHVRGAYIAPGFIDLHVWGEPALVAREAVRQGTTAFLTAVGPMAPTAWYHALARVPDEGALAGAQCLGAHAEGPFLNPARGGALPKRWMRAPSSRELRLLMRDRHVRVMTLAPELRGALAAIRWLAARGVVVSLGHSEADARTARAAIEAGASAVTHLFNGMPRWDHHRLSLLDVALTDARLTAMVIADGIHVSGEALHVALCAKGSERLALVTDSIRLEPGAARLRAGAYYVKHETLAGSALTMIGAVRNAVRLGGASLEAAVRMATEVPARLLGIERTRGVLAPGRRADLVVFTERLQLLATMVEGQVVHES